MIAKSCDISYVRSWYHTTFTGIRGSVSFQFVCDGDWDYQHMDEFTVASARLVFPCCSGGNEENRTVGDLFRFNPRG